MRKNIVWVWPLFLVLSGCGLLALPFLPTADTTWRWGGYFSKYNMSNSELPIELWEEKRKDLKACFFEPRNYLATYRCMQVKGYEFYQRGPDGDRRNICLSGLLNKQEKKEMCHNVLGHELLHILHP